MKIVHTADWHLGKIVHNVYMTEDQEYVLQQFLQDVEKINPDAMIIAGDLYDRAIPPKEAVELLDRILTKIVHDLNIPILAITGNHDSAERMNYGAELFRKNQLYLQTKLDPELKPVVLEDEHGPVYFHLVPYMEPAEAKTILQQDDIHSHHEAMAEIVKRIQDKYDLEKERHIFVGHAFLAGGMETESEERLTMIGGTPYVEAELFKPFTYTALGHLHQPQKVKYDHIRYSGSIFKYSFSEVNHKKSFTVLNLNKEGIEGMELQPMQGQRDMMRMEGYMDDLLNVDEVCEDYCHIKLLDDGEIMDPIGKLRKWYPNILRLERQVTGASHLHELKRVKERQQMSHLELFASFYENMKGEPIPENRKGIVEKVVQHVIEEERGR
ncbi:exonuclease SbcCD subunit D [Salinibacillus xinjiangensis]|uniref:Nuclease SbcCD subunit D n=1 Tax=Salinibacillus xinjiangensis TaxID=1229268 RepID=A0A6G1XBR5_9BACI|nr:exonuclease SbcCD subunit D [Salinibacillus xinjiangensis]MRG88320.1 exonuclease subunit SbcD [Salinibacillus xinjiangensis]